MKRLFLLLSILCVAGTALHAYNFRTVEARHGLSDNYVKDIARDSAGYVYIATQSGVDRFDGYRIKPLPSQGFSDHSPQRIETPPGAKLFVMTSDSLYMQEDGVLKNVSDVRRLPSEACRTAYAVIADGMRGLWILRSDSLFYLDSSSGRLTGSRMQFRARDAAVFADGIALLSPEGGLYTRRRADRDLRRIASTAAGYGRVAAWGNKCLLFGGYTPGVVSVALDGSTSVPEELAAFAGVLVNDVAAGPDGNVWLGTNSDGIHVYSPDGSLIERIKPDGSPFSIPSGHISALYIDESIVVAGTSKRGAGIASMDAPEFTVVDTGVDSDISFLHERADGSFLIGYDGAGLAVYPAVGAATPLKRLTTQNSALPSDLVIGISHGGRDDIFGTYGGGIFALDGDARVQPLHTPDSLRYCRHIIADRDGVWAGTFQNGLFRLGGRHYTTGNSTLQSNCITGLAMNGDSLYVATSHGLSVVDMRSGRLERAASFPGGSQSITVIFRDSRGLLWTGSREGMAVADGSLQPVGQLSARDGLACGVVRAIAEDHSGRLWLTGTAGLSCVRVGRLPDGAPSFDIRNFSEKDGIGDISFNRYSLACTRDGRIVAGGDGRCVVVNPATVPETRPALQVHITEAFVDGSPVELTDGHIEMDYFRHLRLAVSTLTIADAGNIMYEYSVDGGEWVLSPSEIIALGELSDGRHTIAVRAVGSKESAEVAIAVRAPFYRSGAAYAVYALLILLFGFMTWRLVRKEHLRALGGQRVENALARQENVPATADDRFITDAKNIIGQNIAREDFGVEELSEMMAMSRSNLYKKMTAVTGRTPLEFIRCIRMREGRKRLDAGETSVSQIAYAIGMSPKQFAKYFKDETGMTPSQYIKNGRPADNASEM